MTRENEREVRGCVPELSESKLDRLAHAFGIEDVFTDVRGERRATTEATKRSLLTALGAPATNDAEVAAALERLDRKESLRPLPPVLVGVEGTAVTVPLTLPAELTRISWRLMLEDGSVRAGSQAVAALRRLEPRLVAGRTLEICELLLPSDLPCGYHRLRLDEPAAGMQLIISPGRCVVPEAILKKKAWGLTAQLYLLRSEHDWGIGDFGDLRRLVELAAAQGADVIGLNPLHAMFPDQPEHASPYSPASRLLLNVLNINVPETPEFHACEPAVKLFEDPEFQARLRACHEATLVQYQEVAALKLQMLRLVFEHHKPSAARLAAFQRFLHAGGEPLRRGCLYEALRHHFSATQPDARSWCNWPAEFRDPASPAVQRFERQHRAELEFAAWLQFIADEQLAKAAAVARESGMRIGLYRDLAVGSDRDGVEAWSNQEASVASAAVGAPPDILNPRGQNWGLPPFHPRSLRAEGYRSFIALVRANMRHAGAIRIDHAMALQHLYLIPQGCDPAGGAYVQYPVDDLIGILALESERSGCVVIGEDLGTLPEGFRERMEAANIFSYRVLFFEKSIENGEFFEPDRYPVSSLAVIGNHDLPTLNAWWTAADIELSLELGLIEEAEALTLRGGREKDRAGLLSALCKELATGNLDGTDAAALFAAVHSFIARSPALLAMAQLDDIIGESRPVNVPTTKNEYPNWRRRYCSTLEQLGADPRLIRIAQIFRAAGRGK